MNHSHGHQKKSGSGLGLFLAGALGLAAGFVATKIILDDNKEEEEKKRQQAYEQQRAYEQRRASQGGYYQGSNNQQSQQYVSYDRNGNYHPSQHIPQQQNAQQSVSQYGNQAYDTASYVPPTDNNFPANNPTNANNSYNRSNSSASNASNPSNPNNANVNTRMDDCEDIICPITLEVMCRPMISKQCGHSFEKEAILDWLNSRNTCPKCNTQLCKADIIENYSLKNTIAFMRQQTWSAQNDNNNNGVVNSLI